MASVFDTIREAQRIMTRLRLDTTVLHLRLERGILIVSGRVCFPFSEDMADVNYELLHEADRQLRLLKDVKGIEYQLKNWNHSADGGWSKRRIRE
jgi:hypothetical protein